MGVNRNGLPGDRAAEEGAQERIQWLHPRDDNRLAVIKFRSSVSRAYNSEMICTGFNINSEGSPAHRAGRNGFANLGNDSGDYERSR